MADDVIKRAAVIGLGRFGRSVAVTLSELGIDVLAVDSDMKLVEQIQDKVSLAACAAATEEGVLSELEVERVDLFVVGVGENFEVNVLLTSWAAEAGVPMVITRADSPLQRRILERVGATRVLHAEQEMGQRLARSLVRREAIEFVDLPEDFSLREIDVPPEYVGHTLAELGMRRDHGLAVLAVRRVSLTGDTTERTVLPVPHGSFRLEAGDRMSVIARNEDFSKFDN
jgi:trk system potassium uptake protein